MIKITEAAMRSLAPGLSINDNANKTKSAHFTWCLCQWRQCTVLILSVRAQVTPGHKPFEIFSAWKIIVIA